MAFDTIYNNVQSVAIISAFTDTTPSISLATWYWQLFPTTNWLITVELRNDQSKVIKREVIKYASRTWDTLMSLTRAIEICVQDDTATPRVRSQNTLDFTPAEWQVATVSMRYTAWNDKKIKDEIDLKANDNAVVKLTWNQTIWGTKTFSSSPEVPTPTTNMQASTKKYVDDQVLNALSPQSLYETWYKAGEDISIWETHYVEKLPTYSESTLTQNVWDLSWNTRVFQLEVSKGWASTSFNIAIDKVLSPSSNFIVELHTVDGSNLPNGIVHANATATILNSAVTGSKQDLTVNWSWSFTMPTAWTKIAYVFKQTGDTVNATNYYRLYYGTKNTTTRPMWRYTGSTWTTTPLNIWSAINNGRNNGTSSFWWGTLNVTVTVTTTKPVFIDTLTVQSLSGTGTMLLSTWSYTTSVSYTGGVVTLNEYFNIWVTFTLSGNLTFSNWRNTPWSSTGSLLTVSVSTGNHWYLFSTQKISSVTNSSIYISSASSYDDMLSLTDARYIHKLWSYYTRISTDNYSVWDDVISMYYWLYSDYIWLTDKITYYIANIPWAISAVPWNYKKRLGKSVNTNTIYINDEDSIIPWTTFTVASLATARNTTSITFVKAKSTQVVSDWEYTTVFSHQAGVSRTSEAQIYRNWMAYWTLYITNSTSPVVRTENLYFNELDTIEIRHREINWLSAWSTVSAFSVTYSLLSESNSWIDNID